VIEPYKYNTQGHNFMVCVWKETVIVLEPWGERFGRRETDIGWDGYMETNRDWFRFMGGEPEKKHDYEIDGAGVKESS